VKIVESFPRKVREIENCWIPLSDGSRLASRIWLPEDAMQSRVPAILEYLPYRKRDFTRGRDEPMHHYFAGQGYAAIRVDIRGSGDSDGLLLDEYLTQELDDAVEVIRWIASQPWCTGVVGMMGKSWGGFNALQVAARRPPALKAIITVCSTDDRYADDAHYMGGCLLNENLIWGSVLMAFASYPPDPELVGERWREMWVNRLQQAVLFPQVWLDHQRRDSYWKHGSVCEDFSRIQCPVYAIGGWADAYSNAISRLLAGLSSPRKGLVGPWAHLYPHDGLPGPPIGFLQEALRWWDQWLKGIRTGILEEPMYRVWMQESVPPRSFYDVRPGRWVAETSWPSPRITTKRLVLNPGGLGEEPESETQLILRPLQTVGLSAGDWCSFGVAGDLPTDQKDDDVKSLVFDSLPLGERLEILGAPVVMLEIAVDRPLAFVAVRLNDVAQDGSSTRITYGLLNLTHRVSHEHPQRLEPGRRHHVRVRLNDIAHAFLAGHRIRVAISTSYWPVAWPSPESVTLTMYTGVSLLELPVRPADPQDQLLSPLGKPERAPPPKPADPRPMAAQRTITRDPATNETVYTVSDEGGESHQGPLVLVDAINLEVGHRILKRFRIGEMDPLSARAEVVQMTQFKRGSWSVRIETDVCLSASTEVFQIQANLYAYEGDRRLFSKKWNREVPRDLA